MSTSPEKSRPVGECRFCRRFCVVWRFNWQVMLAGVGYNWAKEDAVCKECMVAIIEAIYDDGSMPEFPSN